MVLSIVSSSARGCCPLTTGPCRTLNNAAPRVSAANSISALNVRSIATAITPARTGTVPSARTIRPTSGSQSKRVYCCPCRTSWSPSRCRRNCARWPAATRRRSTTCSFALPLKPYCCWPRTRASSVAASACSACSRPGPDNSNFIPTSTTSSPAAASLTPAAGALQPKTFWSTKSRSA